MRRALVTGAGHGIGAAIAVALAADGCDVAVHFRATEGDTVERVAALGRRSAGFRGDLTDTGDAGRVVEAAAAFLGGLDVLVCNAGHLVGRVPVAGMTDEHYLKVIEANLGTAFRTIRAAMPYLRDAGAAGRVITMSSLAAHNGGGPGAAVYAASKAAVLGLTKGLAKELAPAGVTVNALAPGFIAGTAFHETFTPPEAQAATAAGIPLRRGGTVEEVAAAAVWLASPGAGFVTGTTIDLDGGMGLR